MHVGPDTQTQNRQSPDTNLGRRLGSYELVQRIGEGGMGVVYRGRKTDTGEEIAIKLIKRGMDTDSVLRRFHTERRILETLDHPNIARILDAGATQDGLPYFVMEYIAGQPINRYCDSRKLSVDERLVLFEKVCGAVQCAHEAKVVHRDIKPENILVTADGVPKLLDFGIAKVLDVASATQDPTVTIIPVMTPHYASPEQARGGPVAPASDIYSLGVLLYELLAGCPPYKVTGTSAASFVHAITHEPAQRPSAAVSHMDPADPKVAGILAQRGTDVRELRRRLAGDVDAIVLTALEKDPARRYASAAEFAADIRRHLYGGRVIARRLSRRAAIWFTKTRAIAAVLAVLVIAGLALLFRHSGGQTVNARPSVAVLGFENLSNQASADWLRTALTEMLSTELAAGGSLRTVPGELVTRVRMELALPNSQTLGRPTLARLRDNLSADYVVVGAYLAIGEGSAQKIRLDVRLQDTRTGDVVATASDTKTTIELVNLVTNAGTVLRKQLGVAGGGTADANSVRGLLPENTDAARDYSEGIERLRSFDTLRARELLRSAVAAAPGHALSHSALAAACAMLGYDVEAREEAKKALDLSAGLSREEHLAIEGQSFETIRAWDKAVATYQALRAEYPDNLEYGLKLAAAQRQSGDPRRALQTLRSLRTWPSGGHDPRLDLEEAESLLAASDLKTAREAAVRAAQAGAAQGMRILTARAHLLASRIALDAGDPQGSLAEAAQAQQLFLAAGHRQGVAWALNETAGVLTQRGDAAGARARYEEALILCRTVGDQLCIGTDLDSIGVLRRRQGDLRGALDMHKEAMETRRAVGDRAGVATSLYNSGNVLEIMGDLALSERALSEALEIRQQLGERRSAALTMSRLGNVRRREGDLAGALRMTEEAVDALRAVGDRGGVAMAQFNLGLVLFDQGNLARSRSVMEEAIAIRRQQHDRNNLAQVAAGLAAVALAQDRVADASALITESIALRQELGEKIASAQSNLVRGAILLEQRNGAGVERLAREAAATFREAAAWGTELEANLMLARAQLARENAAGANASLAAMEQSVARSRDLRLRLRCDETRGRALAALGRKDEALGTLERALSDAKRIGLAEMIYELRLALAQTGQPGAELLAAEAQEAGFLRIARKARE